MVWWLLIHGDGDGVVSGALAYNALKGEKKIFFSHPAGLLGDLSSINKGDNIFIADIALTIGLWEKIVSKLKEMSEKNSKIIYIDHHPLPNSFDKTFFPGSFIHDTTKSASELVYNFFISQHLINENEYEMERLALFGAVSDYLDETMWVKKKLLNWDKRMIYFEAGLLSQGLEGSRKLYDFKRRLVKHLGSGELPSMLSELVVRALMMTSFEEEMRKYVQENTVNMKCLAYVIDPPGSVPRAANYARVYGNKPVGVAVEKRKNMAIMSIRTGIEQIDLHRILSIVVSKHNGIGGGHRFAAGARVPLNKLYSFLNELDKTICSIVERIR